MTFPASSLAPGEAGLLDSGRGRCEIRVTRTMGLGVADRAPFFWKAAVQLQGRGVRGQTRGQEQTSVFSKVCLYYCRKMQM